MKKTLIITLVLATSCLFAFSQENQKVSRSQADMYNDFFVGYGGLSIYYFTGGINHNYSYPEPYSDNSDYVSYDEDPASNGTLFVGFSRTLNHVISTGFIMAYQHTETKGTAHYYNYNFNIDADYPSMTYDNLITCIAQIRFCYLDKDFVRMYSGVGVGITLDFSKEEFNGISGSDRKILPAGQLTMVGLRVGRSLAGFAEFGIGSVGIINAGISYKFGD